MLPRLLFKLGVFAALTASAAAVPIDQYASTVIGFSSQYSAGAWAAAQALGAPDTGSYGDIGSAWAPGPINGTLEYLTVGFTAPVYASGVTIRETYGNGFVYRVDAIDSASVSHTVWTGTDPSLPGTPVDNLVTFGYTPYLVTGLTIFTDTDHNLGAWEEIDSIQLHGDTQPQVSSVPDAFPTVVMMGFVFAGFAGLRRRRAA